MLHPSAQAGLEHLQCAAALLHPQPQLGLRRGRRTDWRRRESSKSALSLRGWARRTLSCSTRPAGGGTGGRPSPNATRSAVSADGGSEA
eukprot:3800045-Prymnesium_polylepis.3